MSEENQEYITSFAPVPTVFHSFETEEPFSHCTQCDKYLLDDGTRYVIQKAFRGSEVILEFAWCLECHNAVVETYSKETMTRIWDFFLDNAHFDKRSRQLLDEAWTQLDPWISRCLTCDTSRDEAQTYLLVGECDGSDLIFQNMPYLICETCEITINESMSRKSRDIWDDWIEENLDVPPAIRQDIKDGKILFV